MNKMIVLFTAFFFAATAQATLGISCQSDNLNLEVSQLTIPDEKTGISYSGINPTESFASDLEGVKMNYETTTVKTKFGQGWMVVKMDVNNNGKWEADAVVYLKSTSDEGEGSIYEGNLYIYTVDPQNPKVEPVTCWYGN